MGPAIYFPEKGKSLGFVTEQTLWLEIHIVQ